MRVLTPKGAQLHLRTFGQKPSSQRNFQRSLTVCCPKLLPAPQLSFPRVSFT
jgi:hypothetical protein